ncbi:MAG: hypothetical protein SFZ03_03850 [Candidatus Melainabacteria bacterium]|nr:hypothetical protein [Candidatus Melainabacteria bacterium]
MTFKELWVNESLPSSRYTSSSEPTPSALGLLLQNLGPITLLWFALMTANLFLVLWLI